MPWYFTARLFRTINVKTEEELNEFKPEDLAVPGTMADRPVTSKVLGVRTTLTTSPSPGADYVLTQ